MQETKGERKNQITRIKKKRGITTTLQKLMEYYKQLYIKKMRQHR